MYKGPIKGEPMKRERRSFTPEFKRQAVDLAADLNSYLKASEQLGVNESLIRRWKKLESTEKSLQNIEPSFSIEEFKKLQKENEKLKKVNYILTKAAAFFSQDHLK